MNSIPIEGFPKSNKFKFWEKKTPKKESNSTESSKPVEQADIYWPYHLLPEDCPLSRILTWGYDSKLSHFFQGSANKNDIFAHSRDMFSDLKGTRQLCVRSQSLVKVSLLSKPELIFILYNFRETVL